MGMKSLDKKKSMISPDNTNKDRSGDTGRSSNRGRKQSSGGSRKTNNQGHPKGA
jgi:hypothetical protein